LARTALRRHTYPAEPHGAERYTLYAQGFVDKKWTKAGKGDNHDIPPAMIEITAKNWKETKNRR